ncbi:hypothetical protein [Nostoc sp.]|uniref:hypothetical protein n=1 Tax=Nostoc sp. TaxID=1180 RepID=UPI002FF7F582
MKLSKQYSIYPVKMVDCWSKIKNILRRIGARTYPDLLKALDAAFAEVTIENLLGWFTHCCYCTSED